MAYSDVINRYDQQIVNARDAAKALNAYLNGAAPQGMTVQEIQQFRLENNDDLLLLYYVAEYYKTASGAPATFSDGADGFPVSALTAALPVTQEAGTPAPDNFLEISEHTALTITRDDNDGGSEETYDVSFGAASGIAAGSYDAKTGILTVTHRFLEFDGSEFWRKSEGEAEENTLYFTQPFDSPVADTSYTAVFSLLTDANITASTTVQGGRIYNTASVTRFACRFTGYTDLTADEFADFIASLKENGTPLQAVFKLSTPETYQLDPVEVTTLYGDNRIAASSGGTVAVTYRAVPDLI